MCTTGYRYHYSVAGDVLGGWKNETLEESVVRVNDKLLDAQLSDVVCVREQTECLVLNLAFYSFVLCIYSRNRHKHKWKHEFCNILLLFSSDALSNTKCETHVSGSQSSL
jgi:hypothetical protein